MTKTEILSRALESLEFVIGDLEYVNENFDNLLKWGLIMDAKSLRDNIKAEIND